MEEREKWLIEIGFTQAQVEEMERKFDNVLKLKAERLESAFQNLLDSGLSYRDTIAILVNTPSIFGKSIETTRKQIELYKEIFNDEFKKIILENPRRFIQGYQKTLYRYQLLTKKGVVNKEQLRDIFLPEKQFNKKYEE